MTPAEYAVRGRWALWGAASANMYLELTDDEGDYLNDALAIGAWGMATGALVIPEIGSSLIGWGLTRGAQGGLWAAGILGRGVATVTTAAAPVAAGAAIGAVVGTGISYAIWGEEGAETALGFYSGGLLPGTEAPDLTDYQYIFKPTAPGGPVSAYDVGKQGIDLTRKGLKKAWRRRPRMYRHPRLWMI